MTGTMPRLARRLTLVLFTTALAGALVPAPAAAKPELLKASFHEVPVAGKEVTLELRFRDPDGAVNDVHVRWGDGAVDYAVVATPGLISTPNPLTPAGTEQVLLLKHTYALPGAYLMSIELYTGQSRTDAQLVVDVGPCGAPTITATYRRTGRTVIARIAARDPDGYIGTLVVQWGDGTGTAAKAFFVSHSPPGQSAQFTLRHRFAKRVLRRRKAVVVAARVSSIGNPDSCPTPTTVTSRRRLKI